MPAASVYFAIASASVYASATSSPSLSDLLLLPRAVAPLAVPPNEQPRVEVRARARDVGAPAAERVVVRHRLPEHVVKVVARAKRVGHLRRRPETVALACHLDLDWHCARS